MKRFNLNEFIWFLLLGFNFIFLIYAVYTGKMFLIINLDMRVYVYIAIFIIGIMLFVQSYKIFTIPSRGGIRKGYLIFVFSSICLVAMTQVDIVKTSLGFKEVNLYHELHVNSLHNEKQHSNCIDERNLIINNENFHERLEELIHHVDEYVGKEVEMSGIVYNDSKYKNKFIVTNLKINCCIADSSYLGVLCQSDNIKLSDGQNVTVRGKVNKIQINNKNNDKIWIPLIEVTEVID